MKADLQPVNSSNIAAIGHDPEASQLHVAFKNGGTYVYDGVSPDQHKALIEADSIGSHLHKHFRSASHPVKRETQG